MRNKLKTIVATFISILTSGMLASSLNAQNIMILHDVYAEMGDDITFQMEIQNQEVFVAFQFDVPLPEGFLFVQGSENLNPERKVDHLLQVAVLAGTNIFRAISFSLTNAAFSGNQGIVMTFQTTTPNQAGLFAGTLQGAIISNPNAQNILTGTQNSQITLVTPYNPGDANCDGDVNLLDVIGIIGYILNTNFQFFCFENADINSDGVINLLDVIGTLNIILDPTFICGISTISDIDGNIYNTVLIENRCWMAENLRTSKFRNLTQITNATSSSAWQNNTSGAYVWYQNNIAYKPAYGAIYNWYAVNSSNGLCPSGWHVPTNDELIEFIDAIQSFSNINPGNAVKSCRQVNSPLGGDCNTTEHPRWSSHNIHYGTDDLGYSGLPGGMRIPDGFFDNMSHYAYWWSSTSHSDSYSWLLRLTHDSGNIIRTINFKNSGFSVRCIKD